MVLFQENCAVCHGENLEGAAQGTPLRGELRHGDSMADIIASTSSGYEASGMPTWRDTFTPLQIRNIAMYILETRANVDYVTSNFEMPLSIPDGVIESELHDFRLETLVDNLDPLPYAIEPLPDGRLLLTEKTKGVRIVVPDGEQSGFIRETPQAYDDIYRLDTRLDIERGMGWLFDIVLHPNYEENGWIYLHFGDRCNDCNDFSRRSGRPVSMNKLVRGKIEDGEWVEQETIWQAEMEHYNASSDVAAGGRVAFDDAGHVYFTVGLKGGNPRHSGSVHALGQDSSRQRRWQYSGRQSLRRSR